MLQEYNTEDAISLVITISLLCSLLCFLKLLIDANRTAWSDLSRDKDIAEENSKVKKKGEKRQRISENKLLCRAWFGGLGGLMAILWRWHKVRKRMFLLCYCSRCLIGVCIVMITLIVYLLLLLPRFVMHWPYGRDVMLHFAEWSDKLRTVLHF